MNRKLFISKTMYFLNMRRTIFSLYFILCSIRAQRNVYDSMDKPQIQIKCGIVADADAHTHNDYLWRYNLQHGVNCIRLLLTTGVEYWMAACRTSNTERLPAIESEKWWIFQFEMWKSDCVSKTIQCLCVSLFISFSQCINHHWSTRPRIYFAFHLKWEFETTLECVQLVCFCKLWRPKRGDTQQNIIAASNVKCHKNAYVHTLYAITIAER